MSSKTPTPVKERSNETVFVASTARTAATVIHTDENCPSLAGTDYRPATRAQYPALPTCEWCAGEASRNAEPSTLAAKLRHADSADEALAADSLDELREGSA